MEHNSIVFRREIRDRLLAGVVFMIRCAQRQGSDPQYIAGALAFAEYRALSEGIDWSGVLTDARAALGADVGQLIDAAMALQVVENAPIP